MPAITRTRRVGPSEYAIDTDEGTFYARNLTANGGEAPWGHQEWAVSNEGATLTGIRWTLKACKRAVERGELRGGDS